MGTSSANAGSEGGGTRHLAATTSETKLNIKIWEEAEKEDYKINAQDLMRLGEVVGRGDKQKDEEAVLASAKFLRAHLPPKLAKRIKELQSLPFPFQKDGGSFQEICSLYKESFLGVLASKEPKTLEEEAVFSEMIWQMKANHLTVRQMVGEAMTNMRCTGSGEWVDQSGKLLYVDDVGHESDFKVQNILRSFYRGRIGLRCLVEQHLMLRTSLLGQSFPGEENDLCRLVWSRLCKAEGRSSTSQTIIHTSCKLKKLIEISIADAKHALQEALEEKRQSIHVQIEGYVEEQRAVVPEHLSIVLYEILTNAITATMEKHQPGSLPPVVVTIGNSPGVAIKISDQGGGIFSDYENKVWKFTWSKRAPGVNATRQGLALSRVYTQLWGGDIKILNLEGVGCDVLITFPCPSVSKDNSGGGKDAMQYPFNPQLDSAFLDL